MGDLTYRRIRAGDFDDLHRCVSAWPVVRQLGGWPWPPDPAFTKGRCKPYKGDGFVWAICRNDRLIGSVSVVGGELGYMLDPSVQGQGVASRAVTAAIAHAFQVTNRQLLGASTWHDNLGSYRVLQKHGFTHWATRYEHAKARRLPTLTYYHRLTRTAWDGLRTRSQ